MSPELTPSAARTASRNEVRHHSGHRGLITELPSAESREPGSMTAFSNVWLHDKTTRARYLSLYIATANLVAVTYDPESDYKCWNYTAYSVPDQETGKLLLQGTSPESISACTRRNAMHVRLRANINAGLVADIGAAAAFVSANVDIGTSNLPAVSFAASTKADNGTNRIRARLFSPVEGGSVVATATTHLREDTTSMVAFKTAGVDAAATILHHNNMTPGDACHPLPDFLDLSMFRAEQSSETFIGQLLAQSLFEFTEG